MRRLIRRFLPACLCIVATALPGVTSAQLDVDVSVIELSSRTPREIVRLSNTGADTLYLALALAHVRDPVAAPAELDPSVDPSADGVLVHPRQLIIAPGQSRNVRVLLDPQAAPRSREHVMRLVITPFAGDVLQQPDAGRAGVRFLIGYRLPVFLRPDRLAASVELERDGEALQLVNTGNTNVLLHSVRTCAGGGDRCEALTPNRLYVGERLALPLPADADPAEVRVHTVQGVRSDRRTVDYEPR